MRPLNGNELLHIWETGVRLHPIDRALAILAAAYPEIPKDALPSLSINTRDALLLEARGCTVGSRLAGFCQCPGCAERLEFNVDLRGVSPSADAKDLGDGLKAVAIGGFEIQLRLPNSHDLASLISCNGIGEARKLLIEACLIKAVRAGREFPLNDLPEPVLYEAVKRLEELAPQADIQLKLNCPSCGHNWRNVIDIASFFWQEICSLARRLSLEVHILGRAYGWREKDILSMTAARRKIYLEMVS